MSASIRQFAFADPGNNTTSVTNLSTTLPNDTLAGSTLVLVSTIDCFTGVIGQAAAGTGSPRATGDATNGAYTSIDNLSDTGSNAFENVATYYFPNAGVVTAGTSFTVNFSGSATFSGILVVEVTGVTASPLVGHHAQVNASVPSGTDNVTSGTAVLGSAPVIMLGIGSNTTESTQVPPGAGSFWTSKGTGWSWGNSPGTRFVYRNSSNPGTAAALFSSASTDNYLAALIAFLEQPSGSTLNAPLNMGPGVSPNKLGQFAARPLSNAGQPVYFVGGQGSTATAGTLIGGVTVSVTGQASTFAAGTLVASGPTSDVTVNVNGQVATFAAGYVTANGDVLVSVSGQAATFTAGALSVNRSSLTVGQTLAVSSGTLGMSTATTITGQAGAASAGTPLGAPQPPLVGQSVATTAGTLVPSAAVNVLGQAFASTAGGVSLVGAGGGITWDSTIVTWDSTLVTWDGGFQAAPAPLYGQLRSAGPGISPDYNRLFQPQYGAVSAVPATVTASVSGSRITSATGGLSATVNSTLTVALSGASAIFATGILIPKYDVTVALLGQPIVTTAGITKYAPTYAIDAEYEVSIDSRPFTCAHDPVTFKVTIDSRSFTVAGG